MDLFHWTFVLHKRYAKLNDRMRIYHQNINIVENLCLASGKMRSKGAFGVKTIKRSSTDEEVEEKKKKSTRSTNTWTKSEFCFFSFDFSMTMHLTISSSLSICERMWDEKKEAAIHHQFLFRYFFKVLMNFFCAFLTHIRTANLVIQGLAETRNNETKKNIMCEPMTKTRNWMNQIDQLYNKWTNSIFNFISDTLKCSEKIKKYFPNKVGAEKIK